jgi:exosome complex component RRP4
VISEDGAGKCVCGTPCLQVSGKRWRIDLQSRQEAHLLLSAVNLPGSTQRRRTAEDELNMRSVLKEGDLLSVRHSTLSMCY